MCFSVLILQTYCYNSDSNSRTRRTKKQILKKISEILCLHIDDLRKRPIVFRLNYKPVISTSPNSILKFKLKWIKIIDQLWFRKISSFFQISTLIEKFSYRLSEQVSRFSFWNEKNQFYHTILPYIYEAFLNEARRKQQSKDMNVFKS